MTINPVGCCLLALTLSLCYIQAGGVGVAYGIASYVVMMGLLHLIVWALTLSR